MLKIMGAVPSNSKKHAIGEAKDLCLRFFPGELLAVKVDNVTQFMVA